MKYAMYKYDADTAKWYLHMNFANKAELLDFLSLGTNTRYDSSRRCWTNKYIDGQNLTGKDISVTSRWVYVRDENGYIKYTQYGPCVDHIVTRAVREWRLEDEDGRTVDMRMFKEEVFDMVEKMSHYARLSLHMRTYKRKAKKERMGQASHHNYHWHSSTKSHRFGRTLKTFEESAEDAEEFLTQHQMQCLKVKPKDTYAACCWGDDFLGKGSSGWKDHKNTRQWEAKQKRTDHVWVGSYNKYLVEETEDSEDVVFA